MGYGHTTAAGPPAVTRGMRITEAGADAILRGDLEKFERAVASAVHVPLTQAQFDALVSFTFNLGPGNLKSSTLLRKLNAGDYRGAADQFLRWNKAGGRVLPGLTKRREAERALFLSGDHRPEPKPLPKPAVLPRPVDPRPAAPRAGETPAWINYALAALALAIAIYIATKG